MMRSWCWMFANVVAVQYSRIDVAAQHGKSFFLAGQNSPCEMDKLNYPSNRQ